MEDQLTLTAGEAAQIYALISAPALLGGCVLFGLYLWIRHSYLGLRKILIFLLLQIVFFYLCSFFILIVDRNGVVNSIIRPVLEKVGLDGFAPFFFVGQFFALLVSILLLEFWRSRASRN